MKRRFDSKNSDYFLSLIESQMPTEAQDLRLLIDTLKKDLHFLKLDKENSAIRLKAAETVCEAVEDATSTPIAGKVFAALVEWHAVRGK